MKLLRPALHGDPSPYEVRFRLTGAAMLAWACLAAGSWREAASAVPPVSFGTNSLFATGTVPVSVATGDVNHDGKPDLVTTSYEDYTLSVRLGDGAGGFGTKTDYGTRISPTSVMIGDLSSDGNPDLAVMQWNGGGGIVSVLLGDGVGGFGGRTDFPTYVDPTGGGTWTAALGDLNDDGKLDVVAVGTVPISYNPDTARAISVLLGDGAGGLGAPIHFPNETGQSSAAIGDLNGDGKPDLAVTDPDINMVSVLLNTTPSAGAPATFGPRTEFATGRLPECVAIADFDDDGSLDLVISNGDDSAVSVLLGDGVGGFGAKTDFATRGHPGQVAVGNLNADGKLDLVVTNYADTTVSVLLGNGDGTLVDKVDFTTGDHPWAVAIEDLDADGRLDLAVTNTLDHTVSVLLNTSTVGVEPRSPDAGVKFSGAPNPFNGGMLIQLELPSAQYVRLAIFDLSGRRMRALRSGLLPSGSHRIAWNGLDEGGQEVGAGIYFAQLELPGRSLGMKVVRLP